MLSTRAFCGAAVVALLAITGVEASAQAFAAPLSGTAPSPELDLRIGALWREEGAQRRVAGGGRLALRPWASLWSGRISLQFTGDFRSFGGDNGFDEVFQVRRRITRNRTVLGAAIGVDLLRTDLFTLDLRAGGAIVRTRTNFLIDSSLGFTADTSIWENVCPFEGFKERCSTVYDATPIVSVGLRRNLMRSGAAFVGLDYTGLGTGQHILMGTVGMRLR